MGNTHGNESLSVNPNVQDRRPSVANVAVHNFYDASAGQLRYDSFKQSFDSPMDQLLVSYLGGASTAASATPTGMISEQQFVSAVTALFGTSNDPYLRLFAAGKSSLKADDVKLMFLLCAKAANVSFCQPQDSRFLDAICCGIMHCNCKEELPNANVSFESLRDWVSETCPRLFSALRNYVEIVLKTKRAPSDEQEPPFPTSPVLTDFQLWFVQASVPSSYLVLTGSKPNIPASTVSSWDTMYSSNDDGLSINRFEQKVFGYREHSMLAVALNDGSLYAVAVDDEWRLGVERWGKLDCMALQLLPIVTKYDDECLAGPKSIYFNVKQRGVPQGFILASDPKYPFLTIAGDFSNVVSMDVFACGNSQSLRDQQRQKQWERRQIEKQQKVPLPGTWDENPDRLLLEMAGVRTFYNHDEKR